MKTALELTPKTCRRHLSQFNWLLGVYFTVRVFMMEGAPAGFSQTRDRINE